MFKFILLFMLAPAAVFSQELKEVKAHDKKTGGDETYFVLKANPTIKQGPYKLEYNRSQTRVSGFYNHNLRDSVWSEYNYYGKLVAHGAYKNDEKTGEWEYYSFDGELQQKYNYTTQQVVFNKTKDKFNLLTSTLNVGDNLSPPTYIGGDYVKIKFLQNAIRYPQFSRDNDIQGTVVVSFLISADGKTSNYKIATSVAEDLDAEALRVVQMIPNNWVPAKINGKAVDAEYLFPVVFKLQ